MTEPTAPGRSDDDLLVLLGAALAPTELTPAPERLRELEMLVARRRSGELRLRRPRVVVGWRRRVAVVGVAFGVVVVATGTAFAAGAPIPEPLRALAVDVGLPITPPALARLHDAADALQGDLQHGSSATTTQTERDAEALALAIRGLDDNERSTEAAGPQRLLAEACQSLADQPGATVPPAACTPADASTQGGPASSGTGSESGTSSVTDGGSTGSSPQSPPSSGTGSEPGTSSVTDGGSAVSSPQSPPSSGTGSEPGTSSVTDGGSAVPSPQSSPSSGDS
jgi:hypothetical protein